MMYKWRTISAIAVASALLSANAGAELFNLTDSAGSLSNRSTGNQFSVTVNGITLTAHAYSTSAATPPETLATRAASTWQAEVLQLDQQGIGAGPNGQSQTQPNFSVGNVGKQEIIVIEASRAMNWNMFALGFSTNGAVDANGQLINSSVRLQAWTGGNGLAANYNFAANGVCFSGASCSNGSTNTLANLGFNQSVSLNSDASSAMGFGFTNSGRFLILSGDLGLSTAAFGSEQFFQLKSLSATVPEPGSLALLALGLAGFWAARRRLAS